MRFWTVQQLIQSLDVDGTVAIIGHTRQHVRVGEERDFTCFVAQQRLMQRIAGIIIGFDGQTGKTLRIRLDPAVMFVFVIGCRSQSFKRIARVGAAIDKRIQALFVISKKSNPVNPAPKRYTFLAFGKDSGCLCMRSSSASVKIASIIANFSGKRRPYKVFL